MRCLSCEHINPEGATRCERCDAPLSAGGSTSSAHELDTPRAVERYRRALDKLVVDGALNERAAIQCEKLRAKLHISEELHERLLEAYAAPTEEEIELGLAFAWRGESQLEVALLHRGDFTFERVEVTLFSTHHHQLIRSEVIDLDPDEREVFALDVISDEGAPPDGSLLRLGVQAQIRAIDITEEEVSCRSPLLCVAGGEEDLRGVDGEPAAALSDLTERRSFQALLGGSGWREVPLRRVSEDERFQWEVKISAAREWKRRAESGGWRVGDQLASPLGEVEHRERLCPGGVSWMGAPLGVGRDWETPAHQIRLSATMWCAETPVTQALYVEIMGENPSVDPTSDLSRPVDSVSWLDAIRFCNRLSRRLSLTPVYEQDEETGEIKRAERASGYRLPSEAEWEHLARAGLDRAYAGSNQRETVCWSLEDGGDSSYSVGGRRPNAWGLFDLCGNVWEWCEDLFYEDVYRERLGITPDPLVWSPRRARGLASDPSEGRRVRRGGSWATPELSCRVFTRADGGPKWKSHGVGLRVVRVERGGSQPRDRRIESDEVTWAHLHQARVYLGCVGSSPRRQWALRLSGLGISPCLNEEEADVVVLIPPKQRSPKRVEQLESMRRRARGVGAVVLEIEQLSEILARRESEVHALARETPQWELIEGKRVMLAGRFRVTQSELRSRLSARGVKLTNTPHLAEVLVTGGGSKRVDNLRLNAESRGARVITEVECLALLEAPIPLPTQAPDDVQS